LSTVRRVFFYILTLITLGILTAGLINLLSLSFDSILARFTLAEIGDIKQQLSLGIAMVVTGGPLWFLFWGTIQRHTADDADESGSSLRAFFLNIVLIVSAFVSIFTFNVLLVWLMGGWRPDQFSPGSTAALIVFAAVWYYHWRVSSSEGQATQVADTVRRWYIYILSAAGLIWLSVGLVQLIDMAFIALPIWAGVMVRGSFWNSGTRSAVAWILTGGLVWAFYWFYMARTDSKSSLRQVYFYLLTILGGAIAGLIALTFTAYKILYWLLGGDKDVVGYCQFLGWSMPTILIAACIWFYHLRMAEEEAATEQEHQLSARRVHHYLMSFLGLGTLIAGLIILLGIPLDWVINTLKPETIVMEAGWWNNHLSLGISMLIVSIPLWLHYWGQITAMADRGGVIERRARSRRIYLYVIIGASVVMLAADLVNIVYQLLNGVLSGNLGLEALRNAKWSLQTVFIAVPVLIYHLRIARQDQLLGAETGAVPRKVTVLLSDNKSPVVLLLEQKLGYKVRRVRYTGQPAHNVPQLSDGEAEQLASEIRAAPADKVMLVLFEGDVMVLPYDEG
jgi:large-conductance mechanosensitive channel